MAEMFVSPLVSLLIQNLAPAALSFIPSGGIDGKLKEWTSTLMTIEAVLEDAEDRQLMQKPIQQWLHDVQKLAFEIDDFVDDLATEAQRRQMIAAPESSRSGKLRKFLKRFSPTAVSFNYDMDRKIGEISKSLQELEREKNFLNLQKCSIGGKSENTGGDLRVPSTSLDPPHVCGREKDTAAILTWLLQDRTSDHDGKVRVISIVGMGGMGKTTLAQSLYNNEKVEGCFPDRAWVCVTEDFDVLKISKKIYEEVFDQSCTFNELNKVHKKLMKKLSKKKFLVILDDVWDHAYAKWDLLCAPFRAGPLGSTIIVTTRSQDVAKTVGSKEVCDLKELSDGDCLSLLAQHAFGAPNFDGHPTFKEAGEVIARRCKGLPLAAKSLGGLLRTKGSPKQWVEVSTSKIWKLQSNGIIPALKLSYHHLPPYLKPLFSYCSIFPKAYEFDKQELIMLWMAQGFLRELEGQKQMEDLGCEYFDELLSRSFFQRSTRNESRFVMHDLNNELAQFVAGFICLRLNSEMENNEQYKVSEEVRHASFISHKYDDFKKIKALNAARCLRTFFPIRESYGGRSYLSSLVLKDFPRLMCLRALSFNGYIISEIPKSVGDMKHLRYLDLSETDIKELPKSICDLSNLQTLLLRGCNKLVRLPSSIHKLINLRHLDISDTRSLEEIPSGIGLLTHLRTLSKFIIDKVDGRKISQLKHLHHLQGTLSIIGMAKVINVQAATEANLLGKDGLHKLEMKWRRWFDDWQEEHGLELEVLDMLKPSTGLASLGIEFYGGKKFPNWVGDRSFCDMVKVSLIGCKNCRYLPPLGQLPSLKELYIEGMDMVAKVGMEFLGTGSPRIVAFKSLIILRFISMNGWEDWSVNSSNSDENFKKTFACLQELRLSGCMKLNKVSLPKIPSLRKLEIRGCSETVLRVMVGLGSVKKLEMGEISGLSKLDEGMIGCLGEVENLSVMGCEEMRYLWEAEVACQVLAKLKSLYVEGCNHLESLGDEEQVLPYNLESLVLGVCDKLEKMPNWKNSRTALRQLEIRSCKKLQEKSSRSDNRQGEYEFSNLESVDISWCPSLKWLPTGKKLPTTVRYLKVAECENMEAAGEGEMGMSLLESIHLRGLSKLKSVPQGLAHLSRLGIFWCDGIESISETSLPPTLTTLVIIECRNLRHIKLCANKMQSLTSLRVLEIRNCGNLEDYPSGGSWPPNLQSLTMGDVKQPIKEWGLATLPTSLLTLQLQGKFPEVVTFSDVGTDHLPSSLTRLNLGDFENLECVGEYLQNLSSLRHLTIQSCNKLRELPETLLPTLSSLRIIDSPLLEKRCKKEKRDYWPKISHVPSPPFYTYNEEFMLDCM